MAALEAVLSLTSLHASSSSSLPKIVSFRKTQQTSIRLSPRSSVSLLHLLPRKRSLLSLRSPISKPRGFELCFSVQEIAVEEAGAIPEDEAVAPEEEEEASTPEAPNKKKLYVVNLSWALTVVDIKSLFGECGTVVDVEIIKQKDGKSRGFAFVTMDSGESAQAAIDKFHLQEVSGRVIKVEFAKRFKKPSPPRPPGPQPGETGHKLYVSNLAWKARSTHLRELFSETFKPVSARVVFDAPTGRSGGYGFVSFATREEAEAALSTMDGKELMGRPIRLKFSEKIASVSANNNEEEAVKEDQPEESASKNEEEVIMEDQTQEPSIKNEEGVVTEDQTEES